MSTPGKHSPTLDQKTARSAVFSNAFNTAKNNAVALKKAANVNASTTTSKPIENSNVPSRSKSPSYQFNGSTSNAVSKATFGNLPFNNPVTTTMGQTKARSPSIQTQEPVSVATTGFPSPQPAASEKPVVLGMKTGVKVELAFALTALLTFIGLFIFLQTSICVNTSMDVVVFWTKVLVLIGAFAAAIVSLYCFLERHLAPREGLTSCLFNTTLIATATLNYVCAYFSIGCVCRCRKSAFGYDEERTDLTIFILEIIGSTCLLIIVLVSAVTKMEF